MKTIVPWLVGVAGHVDHGKTSLVRALTGFDTDRFPEEKKRGMSIDMGVAPLTLPSGKTIALIDLPGHGDFMRNMVAGLSSVNELLVTVSAKEGVMPQTVEHVRSAHYFGFSTAILIMTKIDLVSQIELSDTIETSLEFLSSSGFTASAVIPTSTVSDVGIAELLAFLEKRLVAYGSPKTGSVFRMFVRDAFVVAGHGTTVTGVPSAGSVAPGDKLALSKSHKEVRVRQMQSYRQTLERSVSGQSVAINLSDVEVSDLPRGTLLSLPNSLVESRYAVLALEGTELQEVKKRFGVHVHVGTLRVSAQLVLIFKTQSRFSLYLATFDEALPLEPEDKVLVRDSAARHTLGGGRIVSVRNRAVHSRKGSARILIRDAAKYVNDGNWELANRLTTDTVFNHTQVPLIQRVDITVLWIASLLTKLRKAHSDPKVKLSSLVGPCDISEEEIRLLVKSYASQFCITENRFLEFASNSSVLDERLDRVISKIVDELTKCGSSPLARGELEKLVGTPTDLFNEALDHVCRSDLVVSLGSHFITTESFKNVKRQLLELFDKSPHVDLSKFREATGTTRNGAVLLLEKYDGLGVTKRIGNSRILLKTR